MRRGRWDQGRRRIVACHAATVSTYHKSSVGRLNHNKVAPILCTVHLRQFWLVSMLGGVGPNGLFRPPTEPRPPPQKPPQAMTARSRSRIHSPSVTRNTQQPEMLPPNPPSGLCCSLHRPLMPYLGPLHAPDNDRDHPPPPLTSPCAHRGTVVSQPVQLELLLPNQ